jgi:hypothetical protein
MNKIIRTTYFTFNQAEGWMQAYCYDETGAATVKQIIPSIFSTFVQSEGTGHGRKHGHNLADYVFFAPTREYVCQMITNYLNAAAAAQVAPKLSAKDEFMEIREWESTHRLNHAYRFRKSA